MTYRHSWLKKPAPVAPVRPTVDLIREFYMRRMEVSAAAWGELTDHRRYSAPITAEQVGYPTDEEVAESVAALHAESAIARQDTYVYRRPPMAIFR